MSVTAQDGKGTRQLQAILPDWCALTWQHALICFTFLVLFLHFSYLPLPTGQLWHEVANGSQIVNNGFTATDSALPYSDGIRALRTSWLGQSLVYWTHNFGGAEWLSCTFALIQIVTLAVWAMLFQRVSGRRWTAFLVAPIVLASSIDVNALGSSTFALLVFALTALTLLANSHLKHSRSQAIEIAWSNASISRWLTIVGLFLLWANLDISVLVGVGLLFALAISRFIKVITDRSSETSIMSDRELHHRIWLFEICLIATLVQPNGLGLWQSIFWSSNNPILHGLGGWSPLTLASYRGLWIVVAWLAWIAASRRTNSIPLWNIATAIFVTAIVACFETQIVWFATTMCFLTAALLPQLPQALSGQTPKTTSDNASQANANVASNSSLRFAFTLVCGLFLWMGFSLSPIGTMVMSGKQRDTAQIYGSKIPLGATEFLKQNRPAKVVWTPKYWADQLQVLGQPTPVMANLNQALITERIEKDYQSIYYGGKNWKRLLRRYQINDLVVDKENQTELLRELRINSGKLEKVFEDHLSVIYRRTNSTSVSQKPLKQKSLNDRQGSQSASTSNRNQDLRPRQRQIAEINARVANDKRLMNQANFDVSKPEAVNIPRTAVLKTPIKKQKIKARFSNSKPAATRLFGDQSSRTNSIFGD